MEKTLKELQKEEAIKRLEIMKRQGLMGCVMQKFKKKKSELYYSERQRFGNAPVGILYFFNDIGGANPKWLELVKEFEERNNALVYHITHEYMEFGEMLDLFYVSKNTDEWEYDRQDLLNGEALAYCMNVNSSLDDGYNEYGYIGYRVSGGGVIRTA